MSLYVKIEKRLANFNLNVLIDTNDENISLLGASGSGKSMTLKCIAGIEKPDKGIIILNNRVLFDSEKNINLTPQNRNIGYLFQNYALFPNMTVFKNIYVSIKNKIDADNKTNDIIKNFKLDKIQDQYPDKISGGEKQRVALARIIASDPQIMLLDEPFSSVDSYLKYFLIKNLKEIIEKYNKKIILVSHNKDDIFDLCKKIAIIENGIILDYGDIDFVVNNTKNDYSKILLGIKKIEG